MALNPAPVVLGVAGAHATAVVGVVCVAVGVVEDAAAVRTGNVDCATGRNVERDGVSGRLVDALDDVNLTVVRPVRAYQPESRPGAAVAARHVCNVSKEEACLGIMTKVDS
jgi:hypothetical protein